MYDTYYEFDLRSPAAYYRVKLWLRKVVETDQGVLGWVNVFHLLYVMTIWSKYYALKTLTFW